MADSRVRSSRERARRRARIRTAAVAIMAVVAVGGACAAWAMTRSSAPVYRLARVSRADLTQTVDADGTIATVHQTTASFGTSGTVQSVGVRTGSHVRSGQVIARLDPSDLVAAVLSAKQTLASAKQTLATDKDAETSSAATTAAVTGSSTRRKIVLTAVVRAAAPTRTSDAIRAVKAAQKRLTSAQARLDDDLLAEKAAVNTAINSGCKVAGQTTTVQVSATADGSGMVTGSVTGFATDTAVTATLLDSGGDTVSSQTVQANGSYSFTGLAAGVAYSVRLAGTGRAIDTTTCAADLQQLKTAQSAVDDDKSAVQSAITALNSAIGELEQAATSSSSPAQPSSAPASGAPSSAQPSGSEPSGAQPSGSQSSVPTGNYPGGASSASAPAAPSGAQSASGAQSGSASPGNSSGTVTAQQLVADQKAIDAARAALRAARQNSKLAVLRAAISGTVADMSVSAGDSVSSSDDVLTIVGRGRKSVTVDVSLAKIDLVKVGQSAHITMDGHPEPLTGTVTQVGLTNTSSGTGSSATYAVTIVLDRTPVRLYDGMGATVSIDVGSAKSALSVPVSAVTTTGSTSTVEVYSGGTVSVARVTLGVSGESRVQIKSGVKAGQQVVLAEVSAAIPSDSSSTNSRLGGSSLTSGLTGVPGGNAVGGPPGAR